jgi:hypothetical protein
VPRNHLPVARGATDAIAEAADFRRLRDMGFVPHATADGPGLRHECVDGRVIYLTAQPGRRLIDTPSFRMSVTGGGETHRVEEASVEDVAAELGTPGPRP